jgi:hypothetical protein
MKHINKRDTIEGIIFILMTVGVIGLLTTLYEVNPLKGASNFRDITIRK